VRYQGKLACGGQEPAAVAKSPRARRNQMHAPIPTQSTRTTLDLSINLRMPHLSGAGSTGNNAHLASADAPHLGRVQRVGIRALGRTVRLRDKEHLKFVLRQRCLVCGRMPSTACA